MIFAELSKWHKYPDKKPEGNGDRLCICRNLENEISCKIIFYAEAVQEFARGKKSILYWQELPPLPEGI